MSACPKPKRTDDVLYAWAERIEQVAPEDHWFDCYSMICHGDRLFHYGTHFELARILRTKRGVARLVLLNGDSYSGSGGWGPSTSSRQGDVRRVVAMSNVPSLVVPFSALEGAGIDFETIHPVHVRADRETVHEMSSRTRPAELTTMDDPDGRTRTERYYDYRARCDGERQVPLRVKNPNQTKSFSAGHGWCREGARLDEDGVWRWVVHRHWLGDSLFRARSTDQRTRKATAEEVEQHEAHLAWEREHARLDGIVRDLQQTVWELEGLGRRRRLARMRYESSTYGSVFGGDYRLMTRQLFAAAGFEEKLRAAQQAVSEHYESRVYGVGMLPGNRMRHTVTRWATFLSSFDYQESNPLYFLCELPHRARPNTVDEAIQALKPPEVVAAEARGITVTRQGDLFAIPTKLTNSQVKRLRGRNQITKRLRVLGTNHSVTEGVVLKGGAVLGRGVMRHEPEGWRPPDHRNQKIGDSWHMLVRNTVPRTR